LSPKTCHCCSGERGQTIAWIAVKGWGFFSRAFPTGEPHRKVCGNMRKGSNHSMVRFVSGPLIFPVGMGVAVVQALLSSRRALVCGDDLAEWYRCFATKPC